MVTRGEDRRRAIPLIGEVEDRVDVLPRGERPEAIHWHGAEFRCCALGQMGHLFADATDLESIGQ